MIKLIASDLDGTLLAEGTQDLPPELFDLILELKKKGIHFTAASGRQLSSICSLFKPIGEHISYIAENGALCTCDGELLSVTTIAPDLAQQILKYAKTLSDCKLLVSSTDTCYIESGDEEFYQWIRYGYHNVTTVVDDLSKITAPIIKIAIYDTKHPQETFDLCHQLLHQKVNVVTAGNHWIDLIPFEANKGVALRTLAEHLGISIEETMAFGDQQNDMEMLRTAGISYAMVKAKPEVKACADHTTDSVPQILKDLLDSIK